MGGKHKTANRTKNNARPSSSGRSAELLGSSIPPFAGFSGIKDSGFGFTVTSLEEVESSIDPNIQLILKKISKKDSTTKIKGLQEFAEVIKSSEPDDLKSILTVWPRFYNILATDVDNRVREATHNVHHQIVLKAKRNIAPFLKQLMAPWFTSQYDSYPPAASAASLAFKDAFPANKVEEAIIYCQEEILSYINDNLLVQTAQTLSNLKHVSAEEAEAKYERVLIACLQGYYLFLEKVSIENIQKVNELHNNIISNAKYWKLARHKAAQIRAAWFKVLTIVCQKAHFLLEGKGAQVTGTVFNNLEETDPVVLPYVWEGALLTMSSIKDWWTFINIDKVFFPKLWKILKQGGQGNATVIYPSLLPLISRLPPTVDDNATQFFNSFFENMRIGMKQKSTVLSKSESVAVATSFTECLQYVILRKQNDILLCKSLIGNHLLSTIEWCLIEDQTSYKIIFNQISSLIQYWSRNSDKSEVLKTYLDFFFTHTAELIRETLYNFEESSTSDLASIASKQLEFLQSLKHTVKPKKQFKVKFSVEPEENAEGNQVYKASVVDSDQIYFEKLNSLVFTVCEYYVKYIQEKNSKELFEFLCSLLIDFSTKDFFLNLNEKMKLENPNSKLIDIHNDVLYKWFKSTHLCCKYVVDLIFLLFEHINNEEKKLILNSLLEDATEDSLGWCVSEALSHPHNKDLLVKNFLQNEKITNFIVAIADKEINGQCSPELSALFRLALTENENGELSIRKEAITQIMDKLIIIMDNYADHPFTADTCVSLAAYISAIVYTENLLLSYSDTLVLSLFRLSCVFDIDNDIISKETLYEVNTAWQDTITLLTKCLTQEETIALALKFASLAEEKFLTQSLDESHLNHLISVVVNFLRAIYKSIPLALTEYFLIFLKRSFTIPWQSDVHCLCMGAEYVKGNLSSPYAELLLPSSGMTEINNAKYFAWVYLIVGVAATSLEDSTEDMEDEDNDEALVNILKVTDKCVEFFAEILHDFALCRTYLDFFANTKHFEMIFHYFVLIEMKIKSILENADDSFKQQLKDILKEKSVNLAWFWCKAVGILYKELIPESLSTIYSQFTSDVPQNSNNLGSLHLIQVLSEDLNYDHVQSKKDAIADIITLNSLIHCEEIDVQIAEVFAKIEKIRNENVMQFFYDISYNISWEKSQEIIEIVRLGSSLMNYKFSFLSQRHWDFSVLSLVSWASNCLKARATFEKYQFQALLVAVIRLYIRTDNQIKRMVEQGIKSSYIDEWEDVLVESIHGDLAQIWIYLAEHLEEKKEDIIIHLPFIQEFGSVVNNINETFLFKPNDSSLPKWTKFLKRSCSLLLNPQPSLQLWGYKMLLILVPGLIKIDTEAVNTNTPHKKGLIFEQFKQKLVETHEIVNSMLLEFKLGEDNCRVEPSTDSFTYTFAYLLLWDVLLTLCELASTELRYQYADWLRNEDLLKNFLNNLFRLMPSEILHYSETKSKSLLELFLKKPEMHITDSCDSEKIEILVCWLYSSTLTQLPALVRQWWTSLDTKIAQVVEKVTSMYVSPNLCIQELNEVMTYQSKFKNMVLKVMPTAREVIAIYTVDEAQVELVITLPLNYPLGGLEVQCNRQIGGTSHKQWLLQFKKCVLHQNGRIWDGLSLWNNNLDKKFDGVEECYICFAVLHPGTYQLPKLSCQTCKKKFHSACLYKWFRTSYKSSCPICRNLF